jgi:prevent-host-death family protein
MSNLTKFTNHKTDAIIMFMKSITVQQTRENFAEVIEKVAVAGEKFVVTKFGKPRAMIVPIQESDFQIEARSKILTNLRELWSDRADMDEPVDYVKKLREQRRDKVSA